jgi:hypothetical protein
MSPLPPAASQSGLAHHREGGHYSLEHTDADGMLRRTPLPTRSAAAERLRSTA